jgi:hypothetical protein
VDSGVRGYVGRMTRETKSAPKTTELYVLVASVIAIIVAAWWVGRDAATTAADAFTAERAWLYITIVAAAYIVSRGLAKSGTQATALDDPDAPRADLPPR